MADSAEKWHYPQDIVEGVTTLYSNDPIMMKLLQVNSLFLGVLMMSKKAHAEDELNNTMIRRWREVGKDWFPGLQNSFFEPRATESSAHTAHISQDA